MIWNDHKKLEGLHAFLGASQFHWINWNDETFVKRFISQYSTDIGTIIHELASNCIKNKIKIDENDKHLIEYTLSIHNIPKSVYDSETILYNLIPFVNDSIGFHMSSEIILYYSKYCFGTADAIGYDEKEHVLRIHDFKSGVMPAHMEQLMIYAALFCLEYHKDPHKIKRIELRIYQNQKQDDGSMMPSVIEHILTPETQEIDKLMSLIKVRSDMAQTLFERNA